MNSQIEPVQSGKFVIVDMSATLLHHGHIRILKFAATYGPVRIALTTDDEIFRRKGYIPELSFNHRKEILESIRYVTDVVPTPWLITDEILERFACGLLVHGDDNQNAIYRHKVVTVLRTPDISSTILRTRVLEVAQHRKLSP